MNQSTDESPTSVVTTATRPLGHNPAFIVTLILMSYVFMLLVDFFFVHPEMYDSNIRTQIVTAILLIIGTVGGYWIGSSFSSARKTELVAEKMHSE